MVAAGLGRGAERLEQRAPAPPAARRAVDVDAVLPHPVIAPRARVRAHAREAEQRAVAGVGDEERALLGEPVADVAAVRGRVSNVASRSAIPAL